MSEITRAAIGMPFEMAMENELSRRQFHSIAQALLTERDQLRAEVAGLRTGYEAYEQVNAELKAEVEALRRGTGNRYAPPRAPLTGPSKCLACGELHYGMGGLPCPNMRITAQADLPETRSGQIGAALGQGEKS